MNIDDTQLDVLKSLAPIILFGEFHGTTEMPMAFGEVVELLSRSGEALVVGIELPATDREALRAFVAPENGNGTLKRTFFSTLQDGRGSESMLDLFRVVRRLKEEGREVEIETIIPSPPATSNAEHEERMAAEIDRLATQYPQRRVVVLLGNMHAITRSESGRPADYDSCGVILSRHRRVSSVRFEMSGGEAWCCNYEESTGTVSFGPKEIKSFGDLPPPGQLTQATDPRYDFEWNVGTVTSSIPATV